MVNKANSRHMFETVSVMTLNAYFPSFSKEDIHLEIQICEFHKITVLNLYIVCIFIVQTTQ